MKIHVLGDYNIDLLDLKSKGKAEFEEMVISSGYVPLVSISTHHRPDCNKTYIDNIIYCFIQTSLPVIF